MDFLSLLFPKYCVVCKKFGSYVCDVCFSTISLDVEYICLVCNKQAIDGITHPLCKTKYTIDGALASVKYAGTMKRMIAAFKFRPYLSDLQHVLTDLFYEGLLQNEQFHRILRSESLFVPIPLYKQKERERGYNHAELLAKELSKRFGIKTVNLLGRVKKTENQMKLDREKRKKNIEGAFEVLDSFKVAKVQRSKERKNSASLELWNSATQVILIDDIITSGTTML